MKHNKLRRAALVSLALVFLAFAWIWDALAAVARFIGQLIPWARFKSAFVALIDRLPAPLVLLVFLVPFLIVEPLLVVATVAVAMGYVLVGAIAWIVLKILAIALIPAIFDLTQHRLMTMPWFVRAHRRVMDFHHYADSLVAPYKQAAAGLVRRWKRKAATIMGRDRGVTQRAARFVSRKRSGNGRPPIASNS